ncbi:MAG: undecaprenyl-phosphate glucose phosphotransferase, partial [Oscillospiraceae bacterium]|nr:undecaprenyl-phosphate glucose phosphotransferase [Oscillospiraceae bacterium]
MNKKNQLILNSINMLSDIIAINVSYYIAVFIRFNVLNGYESLDFITVNLAIATAVYSVSVVLVSYALHMYGSYRFKRYSEEIINIMLINGGGIVVFMAALYAFRIEEFSRLLLVIFWLFSCVALVVKRVLGRFFLRHSKQLGYSKKRVAIVGNGHLAYQCVNDILSQPHLGIELVGYISATPREGLGKLLGRYELVEEIVTEYDIDELIVALESHEVVYMKNIIASADKEGIRISLIPFFNDYFPSHVRMDIVGRTKLIDMRATPLDNLAMAIIKRAMDICGSLALIIMTSPLMLAAAIGVKISSPGPIFFTQNRVGLNKKPFKMLKFRSMRVNAEETTGWSRNVDPRKTRFGSFIRKYSIDELPQLFNVLVGDMSLVGPRPEIPHFVSQFKEEIPLYLVRQQVRPGMTGWAQVNGLRGDTSIIDRVEYDIWYIENWSLALDIRILFKT